jgi:hypothetical protein
MSICVAGPGFGGELPLDPRRAVALLFEPGLVHDEDPAGSAKVIGHVLAHLIGIPAGGPQQPLQCPWPNRPVSCGQTTEIAKCHWSTSRHHPSEQDLRPQLTLSPALFA